VHHFGFTRFSLFSPDSKSWRTTRREVDPERYAEFLFSEERMEPRCAIFCDLAAPLYQQMAKGSQFRHVVLYSPRLPERWLSRLREAARQYPVLWLVEAESDRVDTAGLLRSQMHQRSGDEDAMVVVFRIDDDDLLSIDYVEQVEQYAIPQHDGYAVAFTRGYAGLYEGGRYTEFRELHQFMPSMGQAVIGRWHSAVGRLSLDEIKNHSRTHYRRTVLLTAQRPTFVQTRHVGQDTVLTEGDQPEMADAREVVLQKLSRLPTVEDLDTLYARFPTLQGPSAAREETTG
jgi:hypothetical protein